MWQKILVHSRIYRRLRQLGTKGTAMVEFALVAPFLLLTMSGTWDFGNAIIQHERMESAARAAVAYGIQNPTTATDFAGMTQAARNDANDAKNALQIAATQTCTCPGGGAVACNGVSAGNVPPWTYIQVQVQEPYTTVFPYPFVANPINISSQVIMRAQ